MEVEEALRVNLEANRDKETSEASVEDGGGGGVGTHQNLLQNNTSFTKPLLQLFQCEFVLISLLIYNLT